jgi:undecaprenyl-diphosphatase
MNQLLAAMLLGLVEGVTEFLPVSSTGHLLLAEHWLGQRSDLFNVSIQLGAILAVVLVYRTQLSDLITGLRCPAKRDELLKIIAAFLVTAFLGLLAKIGGLELSTDVSPVAAALFVGAVIMIVVEWWAVRRPLSTKLSWGIVMAVGIAQVVAGIFPGTSRSGAAMIAAIACGLTDRPKAAQFAFLVGIPTMFAAAAYELLKGLTSDTPHENWQELALAAVVSATVGFLAVRWLIKFISGHSLVPFAIYRVILAAGLWLWL